MIKKVGLLALGISLSSLFINTSQAQSDNGDQVQAPYNQIQALFDAGDIPGGIEAARQLAVSGDTAAKRWLGDIYSNGNYLLPDYAIAVDWYRQAAVQGDAMAMNALGRHLAEGLGITKNLNDAKMWLQEAALFSDAQHQHDLAKLLAITNTAVSDPVQAVVWFKRAAEQGHVPSMASLGTIYLQGQGVPKNLALAKQYLKAAAEGGNAKAQNNLGLLYSKGEEEPVNHEQAVYWFDLAAKQGLKEAITNLGVMYENGFGVPFDEAKAQRLYAQASQQQSTSLPVLLNSFGFPYDERLLPMAEQKIKTLANYKRRAHAGDPTGIYLFAYLLSLPGNAQDLTEAAKWYQKATTLGVQAAMLNLGLMYLRGEGLPQNYVKGYDLIKQAAVNGSEQASLVRDAVEPFLLLETAQPK